MEGIRTWIEAEGTGHWFFFAFPVCLLCLFIWFKGNRVRFLIPSLILCILIINPWFYKKWKELGLYAYWRILWVLPVIPVIAAIVPSVSEIIRKNWIKIVFIVVSIMVIMFGGTFLYNGAGGSFVETANTLKLPEYVVQIANRLLELDEHPKIIAQDPIGVYIRQYNGNIDCMYGRDLYGIYIADPNPLAGKVHNILSNPDSDISYIPILMTNEGYDYLIVDNSDDNIKMRIQDQPLEIVDQIGEFGIYKSNSKPTERLIKNELGQIVTKYFLDNNGEPTNGPAGYSTVYYQYDDRNNIIYEFRTDKNGFGVADENGVAGFEREYDEKMHIIRESTIGPDGNLVVGPFGYAEVRRTYDKSNIISERYFNAERAPVCNLMGFSSFTSEYDEKNQLIKREYYDERGEQVNRKDGYSRVEYVEGKVHLSNIEGTKIQLNGINLFIELETDSNGWTNWITPSVDVENECFSFGRINLGENMPEDSYSCQLEIEFRDVEAMSAQDFLFRTQGAVDGKWNIGNVWEKLVRLTEPPQDGIYRYSTTRIINKNMSDAKMFDVGFRCDNWASGSFRVRKIKIEKNETSSEWTPGI